MVKPALHTAYKPAPPIHLINSSLFVTGREQVVESRRSRPRTSADRKSCQAFKYKEHRPGTRRGFTRGLHWFMSLASGGRSLINSAGRGIKDQDSKGSVTVAFPVIQALALALVAGIPIRFSPDSINVSRRSRHRR